MERSWSEAAKLAFNAYPWATQLEKERGRELSELVAFGDRVEVADLPLSVRRWLKLHGEELRKAHSPAQAAANAPASPWTWKGESWKELTERFEKEILEQALAANRRFVAKAARALKTTPRVVAYKARKYGLVVHGGEQ